MFQVSSFRFQRGRGFTMIEMVITISILSFGIISIYAAFVPLFGLTSNISNRFTASYLAQEGFEIARNVRDNNFLASNPWLTGLSICQPPIGCELDYKTGTAEEGPDNEAQSYGDRFLNIGSDNFYIYDADLQTSDTIFKRRITVTEEEQDAVMKILVEIFWDYNNKSYEFETEGYLYNWYTP